MERRISAEKSPPELSKWPPRVVELARRVELLEAEASFAICDPGRRERLRQEARRLTAELEAAKAAVLTAEAAPAA
jgi:hypothetical protein